jgi:hypothetical protein
VCVEKCPTENFALIVDRIKPGWEKNMICKNGVDNPVDIKDAEKLISNNMCAGYYLNSSAGKTISLLAACLGRQEAGLHRVKLSCKWSLFYLTYMIGHFLLACFLCKPQPTKQLPIHTLEWWSEMTSVIV